MLPSAAELTYFLEVASTENISRAAERLGITQPTLSLAIQRLERSFGVPLLIRGKSGVKLTQTGQRLVSQARHLIVEWERVRTNALKEEAASEADGIRGRYTLGCHPSVALYSLPHFLPQLLKSNPGLEIKLTHDLSRKVTEEVISFKVDFGIVVNPTQHPDLVIRELCKDEVGFWAGAGKAKEPSTLICDPELLQTQSLVKSAAKLGYSFSRTIPSSNLEVIAALVASGAGVGVLPARVATRLAELKLKPLSKDGPIYRDTICLVYRADAQASRSGRALAQSIFNTLSERI